MQLNQKYAFHLFIEAPFALESQVRIQIDDVKWTTSNQYIFRHKPTPSAVYVFPVSIIRNPFFNKLIFFKVVQKPFSDCLEFKPINLFGPGEIVTKNIRFRIHETTRSALCIITDRFEKQIPRIVIRIGFDFDGQRLFFSIYFEFHDCVNVFFTILPVATNINYPRYRRYA